MKALVIKPFRDKTTKEMRRAGKIIDVTVERFEEINSTAPGGFLAMVGIDPGETVKTKTTKKKQAKGEST